VEMGDFAAETVSTVCRSDREAVETASLSVAESNTGLKPRC
jgi:hypothetical protein